MSRGNINKDMFKGKKKRKIYNLFASSDFNIAPRTIGRVE